jgi:thiamine biosynthesis lipoprotein
MSLRLATACMGTRFELVLAPSPRLDGARLRAAGEAALARIEECDARYSAFRTDSLVARINRAERSVRLDEESYELLEAALELQRASRGAFDAALGRAMLAWGLRGEPPAGHPLGAHAPGEGFALDPLERTVRLAPARAIDLGAIAKGHALDLAMAALAECGVECALLHGGTSSVAALGNPPLADGWSVAIEGGRGERPRAVLRDGALSVSAGRGRTAAGPAGPVGHVLDPASGAPAPLGPTVAVAGPSARLADAWSTALCVLAARGEEAAAELPPGYSAIVLRAGGTAQTGARPSPFRLAARRSA